VIEAMNTFVKVCKVADVPDPGKQLFEVGDTLVVLVHIEGKFYCIDDVCTHDGGPLSEGGLLDHTIACPRHGARFDVRDGRALTMPATEPTRSHEVKVEGDDVLVRLFGGQGASGGEFSSTTTQPASSSAALSPTVPTAASASAPSGADSPVAAALTEDHVREELKVVIDPELFVNIIDLGLVYSVDFAPRDDGKTDVNIEMTLTSPMCPAGPQLIGQSKQVVGRMPQVGDVSVRIVLDPPWTPDRMTEEARDQLGIF
jgi:metal-sulfur cluster biosynthetic enzyme/nitrite reductase/ring-hydroxylating ferredoxin subunit